MMSNDMEEAVKWVVYCPAKKGYYSGGGLNLITAFLPSLWLSKVYKGFEDALYACRDFKEQGVVCQPVQLKCRVNPKEIAAAAAMGDAEPPAPPPKFVLVGSSDRWEGLYVDGKLRVQGHEVTLGDLALAARVPVEQRWADDDWLAERGHLPESLAEVVES